MKRDTLVLLKSLSFLTELLLKRNVLCFSPRAFSALVFGGGFFFLFVDLDVCVLRYFFPFWTHLKDL